MFDEMTKIKGGSAGRAGQRLDAAIVDLDGTLVDTLPDLVVVALNATLGELGLAAVGRDFVEATVGPGSEHLIRRTLAQVGAPPVLYEPARLACVTNKPTAFAQPLLAATGPTRYPCSRPAARSARPQHGR